MSIIAGAYHVRLGTRLCGAYPTDAAAAAARGRGRAQMAAHTLKPPLGRLLLRAHPCN